MCHIKNYFLKKLDKIKNIKNIRYFRSIYKSSQPYNHNTGLLTNCHAYRKIKLKIKLNTFNGLLNVHLGFPSEAGELGKLQQFIQFTVTCANFI